jgi:hypothetical protein
MASDEHEAVLQIRLRKDQPTLALGSTPPAAIEQAGEQGRRELRALTIVVLAVRLMRRSASSTRSSANRGCRGAFVNGGHAVEDQPQGAGCAATVSHGATHAKTRKTARVQRPRQIGASNKRIGRTLSIVILPFPWLFGHFNS